MSLENGELKKKKVGIKSFMPGMWRVGGRGGIPKSMQLKSSAHCPNFFLQMVKFTINILFSVAFLADDLPILINIHIANNE